MAALDGYTVIDLSVGIAGAYCTKMLADGGATVVKVEAPQGDPLRGWSASGAVIPPGEDGALFSFLAGAKRSVIVDPQKSDDLDLLRRLAAERRRRGVVARICGRRHRGVHTRGAGRRVRPPDRHVDHPVRPRRAVGGQARHRVHRAGLVGRSHRARPGCPGPRAAVRRGTDRRVARRSICGSGHDGSAIRAWWTYPCSRPKSSVSLTIQCPSSMCWAGRSATCVASPFPVSPRRPTG